MSDSPVPDRGDETAETVKSDGEATVSVNLKVGKKRKRDIEVAADLLADVTVLAELGKLYAEHGSMATLQYLAKSVGERGVPERAEAAARELVARLA